MAEEVHGRGERQHGPRLADHSGCSGARRGRHLPRFWYPRVWPGTDEARHGVQAAKAAAQAVADGYSVVTAQALEPPAAVTRQRRDDRRILACLGTLCEVFRAGLSALVPLRELRQEDVRVELRCGEVGLHDALDKVGS